MTRSENGGNPPPPRTIQLWPLLLVLLMLGFALFGEKGVLRVIQSGRQKAVLKEEVRRLEEVNSALRQEIEALRSDRRYIENIARRELGMVKQDELIYQFPPRKQTAAERPATEVPDQNLPR
ncbi:cell division protein FtsB [Desulfuromonas soudanensis]|uniref:Cell division protein FtsB n=1 Tax=Desulfuromonas soudanensis TaxID=1603606 RepID=A0A0M4DB62_9BACT|nr:septum formation initiator family protein [Desulfuromonas soudanensis]ALC17542.1 cell division protein FtsB [Desulfuromonas soudanensis]